ncbi:MAG TPA: ABC transporter permease [Thermoanaerobaculia bacterium]|nr:ABC transporter permease [Thermoanaerobaculia bacterium]
MSLLRALAYFLREAGLNLRRSWKISLLAIATIAVTIFIGGGFLLVAGNLADLVEEWKEGAKVVVYLRPGVATADAPEVARLVAGEPWVRGVAVISAAAARDRFRRSFPSIADLVDGWGEEPLPASFEVALDPLRLERDPFESWLGALRAHPQVGMVDDDRDWLRQLEAALRLITAFGLALGGVLLAAAIFTIASVIRLTAYLYREEISVMRLVGATEFFIRGPFYVEGLIQGLVGGVVALTALYLAHAGLVPQAPQSLVGSGLTGQFLALPQQALLVAVAATSGLVGAVLSLRREAI